MAKLNLVKKRLQMGHRDVVKFQILTYCFMRDIQLSNNELDCLTLLGVYGEYELSEFCNVAVEERIFKTPQTVRNFLTKATNLRLVNKDGTNKKKISLKDDMKIQTKGNIILDYKVIYVTKEQ